ncbi:MAG: flavocytochrome c [Angelakisella sp.]
MKKNKLLGLLLAMSMVIGMLSGCGTTAASSSSVSAAGLFPKPGTYTASSKGNNADIKVEVTVDADKIVDVKVLEHKETPGLSDAAINELPKSIVAAQSTGVDAISGCTVTSKAVLAAVSDCIAQAGANPETFNVAVEKTAGELVKKTADVIVIGGGGAGMAAATSAAENGASVIVIEKNAALGGNTILAGGGFNAANETRQRKQDMTETQYETVRRIASVEPKNELHAQLLDEVKKQMAEYEASNAKYLFDSVEFHALQTYDGGDYMGDIDLIYTFAKGAADSVGYLEEHGLKWLDTTRTYLGALWPRSHEASEYKSGQGFINVFADNIKEKKLPVEYSMETTATELMMNGEAVVGVKATDANGTPYEFTANKGVIIATGGFAGNKEMRKKYDPSLSDSLPTSNNASITGDGIIMAEKIGANLVGMEEIQVLPICDPVTGSTGNNIGPSSGMMINKEGVRFVNEDERRDVISAAVLAQTDALFYVICNEPNTLLDANKQNKYGQDVADLISQGKVIKGETAEDLAKQLNIDPAVFNDSIAKFNAAYKSGNDPEFGRTNYDKYVDLSAGGPYYATPRSPAVHHTMGGIQIDSTCQVYNVSGKPIQGLWAAGEVTGGIHGGNRLGGNAIPDAIAFGRIAGESVAKG